MYGYTGKQRRCVYTVYFKENISSSEYKKVEHIQFQKDIINKNIVYSTHIDGLKYNTEYIFRIGKQEYIWQDEMTFSTKGITEEILLPNIETGNGNSKSLLLVEIGNDKLILDTQYHGTYAFDSKGNEYTVTEYARYATGNDLKEELSMILTPTVFAASGPNCQTNITINSSEYSPSKAKTIQVIDAWTAGCLTGGYPEVCYEDVYCKSLQYGINPAFAITIWAHESGGSNYAYRSNVEDFGIHGNSSVPVADFKKQIEFFLQYIAVPSYIGGCTWSEDFQRNSNPTLSKEIIMWGSKYFTGKCSDESSLKSGYEYMLELNRVYSWFTNSSLSWPFTVSKNSSACSYSSASTNTKYNSCTAKGEPSQPPTPPTPPTTPTGDGVRDWLAVTGRLDSGKVISPEVDRFCGDVDGCICIWKLNIKPGEVTKNASYGYTCTVSGKIVSTPTPSEDAQCGTRATSYPGYTEDWPSDSTLCKVGNPNPATVNFPETGKSVSWYCINGTKSKRCTANVSTIDSVCCLSDQSVSWIAPKECTGKILNTVEQYNCVVKDSTLHLDKGVNFIQAMEVVNYNEVPIKSAKELIEYSNKKIIVVGEFLNNEWVKVVKYNNESINGEDFNLEPGGIYLIVSLDDIDISFKGISILSEKRDLTNLVGWNLIPSSQFKNVSSNSKGILTNSELKYISQIAIWDKELGLFKYTTRDEGGQIYGESLTISSHQGIFIRVDK